MKCRLLVAAVVLAFTQFCRAAAPNGSVSFSFSAADAPVWDLLKLQGTVFGQSVRK